VALVNNNTVQLLLQGQALGVVQELLYTGRLDSCKDERRRLPRPDVLDKGPDADLLAAPKYVPLERDHRQEEDGRPGQSYSGT
jgi:hypothetical protein